ncbi:MAG: hypothetical protein U5L10_00230 [Candidatus Moranbacteria bacterium]|nr:hypothetical protein [Candidatus Moranbacteria bacterium]
MLKKNKKRILVFITIVFAGLLFLGFGEVSHCQGQSPQAQNFATKGSGVDSGTAAEQLNPLKWLANQGVKMAASVMRLIFLVANMLLAGAMWFLEIMLDPQIYKEVFFNADMLAAIDVAWTFVRDFFNMFFIVLIMFIALSTVLGIPKFSDKSNILRVLGAAVLVNFSKPITLAFIDASQVVMNFFMQALNVAGKEFTSKMTDMVGFGQIWGTNGFGEGAAAFMMHFLATIFVLILAFMLFVLAIALLVRVVAFWVLIITSPMAFFGFAVPGGGLKATLWGKWFDNLLRWCFFGPIMLLFLLLAFVLVNAVSELVIGDIEQFKDRFSMTKLMGDDVNGDDVYARLMMNVFSSLIPFATAIFLLFYGYSAAKGYSTGAASTILNWGDGKMKKAGNKMKGYSKKGLSTATLAGTRKDAKEAARERWEDYSKDKRGLRFTTQKGRDRKSEERRAWMKSVGRDDKSAQNEVAVKRANEQMKKFEENPPNNDELKDKMLNNQASLGEIMHLSKNNQLGVHKKVNLYEKAMANKDVASNEGVRQKIYGETKKENLGNIIDYETEREINKARQEKGGELNEKEINDITEKVYKKETKGRNMANILKNQNANFFVDQSGKTKEGAVRHITQAANNYDKETLKKIIADSKDEEILASLRKLNRTAKSLKDENELSQDQYDGYMVLREVLNKNLDDSNQEGGSDTESAPV